jgi:hypothetical protein
MNYIIIENNMFWIGLWYSVVCDHAWVINQIYLFHMPYHGAALMNKELLFFH